MIRGRRNLIVTGLSFLFCGGAQSSAKRYLPLHALRNVFLSFQPLVPRSRFISSHLPSMRDGTSAGRLMGGSRDCTHRRKSDTTMQESRLQMIRKEIADAGVQAFIVPSGDPHLSEYVHPAYRRLEFISGFTGSAGTVVITEDDALLWTDGRYFLQAENELSRSWTLMRKGELGVPDLEKWLAESLPDGAKVGIDPFVHSGKEADSLFKALHKVNRNLELLPLTNSPNLVDLVWGSQRPSLPNSLARILPLSVSGQSVVEKLAEIKKSLVANSASSLLVTALDEVCWLLNVRGADVPRCPVLQAYVLVYCNEASEKPTATLFVDESKISRDVGAQLQWSGINIAPYDEILNALCAESENGGIVMFDPNKVNFGLQLAVGDQSVSATSPIDLPKAIKNDAEIAGMMEAHIVDGAAVAKFFAWLEQTVVHQQISLSEVEIAEQLAEFRSKQPGFLDLSFDTIAGVGPNAAIIHYNPLTASPDSVRTLDGSQLMLLDSGGQYATGTTDVTRTIHLGKPTPWQRECFTRVLKGNIALDTMTFPEDTPGLALDAVARSSLWSACLDYNHGTGHGVGAALNVHEGPQSISKRYGITQGLREGMIVSNEPGYYEQGKFGIRIENLLVIREKKAPYTFDGRKFLCFEQLTHIPIQLSLIDVNMLNPAEIQWINAYHARVWDRVSPRLQDNRDGLEWLRHATRPLEEEVVSGSPKRWFSHS